MNNIPAHYTLLCLHLQELSPYPSRSQQLQDIHKVHLYKFP